MLPNGALIVFEQGNNWVQSFDINGTPVHIFAGKPFFVLRQFPNQSDQDFAVSFSGTIFVIGRRNHGESTTYSFLDTYTSDGSLSTTNGVLMRLILSLTED